MKLTFQSERLNFRRLHPDDLGAFMPFFTDLEAMRYFDPPENRIQFGLDWIERQVVRYQEDGFGLFALVEKKSGKVVGQCGPIWQDLDGQRELEIGYHLIPEFWKQGYAIEAAQVVRDVCFEAEMAPSIISMIHIENAPSQKVAMKNGMTQGEQSFYKQFPIHVWRIKREEWEKEVV